MFLLYGTTCRVLCDNRSVCMKLLVIEDSKRLRDALRQGFEQEGYAVDIAEDGEEGIRFCASYQYEVIVLDLMMPKLDGYGTIKQLRQSGNDTHILVLSAKDQLLDRTSALDMGADDFLLKPFAFEELLARVRALVRRKYGTKSSQLVVDDLTLDTSTKTVLRDGKVLPLSAFEYNCLEYLVMQRGRITTKEQIIDHLHNANDEFQSNVVEVLIYSLRKKLEIEGADSIIKTKRGHGYYIA